MNSGHSRWRGSLAAAVLALLVVLAVGLAGGPGQSALAQTPTPTPAGQQTVRMDVLKGRDNSTLALVTIFINGQGPYDFVLDTGASRSVVDRAIVDRLGLPIVGSEQVTGTMGVETADLVQLNQWRADSVNLPSTTAFAIDFPAAAQAEGLGGFLGSDVLSQYDSVTINYDQEELILRMGP